MTEEKRFESILESITDGLFAVDRQWKVTIFNRAAEQITGFSRSAVLDRRCWEVFRADSCGEKCGIRKTLSTGEPVVGQIINIVDAKGRRKPVGVSASVIKDEKNEIVGGVVTFRDLSLTEKLHQNIDGEYVFEGIISKNRRMQRLFDIMPQVAESESTVLIEGESGTGKELLAKAIHNLSSRSKRPFIVVNCGALPDTLLESELFGYKAGAFTGAKRDKRGRFALAEGGTLFLDEIGDISPALQVRLLRFLQDRIFEPLGAEKSVQANVRIVAATNKTLETEVKKGRFREDLYYRINVVRLELPPLRERMEDIPLLVDHFISRFNLAQNKNVLGISEEALTCLMSYDYPGNVRELENIIERAFVLCKSGLIEQKHLPEPICNISCVDCPKHGGFRSLKEMEAAFLMSALRRNNWNRLKTAQELGIHKTTLFRKIKNLGLRVPLAKKSA